MTTLSISAAMKAHGLRAEYNGHPAMILPVTAELAGRIDRSQPRQGVTAGQIVATWNDGEKRNGTVLDGDAANNLAILVKRNDGTDLRIQAGTAFDAALGVLRARNGARENAAAVVKANETAQAAYERALERGDRVDAPEPREPEFPENAFDEASRLAIFAKELAVTIKADARSDMEIRNKADRFVAKITELDRDTLTAEQRGKIDTARKLRAEISMLAPTHVEAAGAVLPPPYQGDGKAASKMIAALPNDPEGISAAQRSIMAMSPDMNLVTRLFSVATTTPAMQVGKMALSHAGFKRIAQDLVKHENTEHGPAVVARMTAVTKDAMSTYDWEGKLYTKDGADVLLMRDGYAGFAYVWDAASRVNEVNVEETVLLGYSEADIPSDEEIERLQTVLADLRHDNGADIDFGWDEEPEDEDDVLDFD
jgi:hypothetical protein